ncbi:MAG: vancomycin high temperature exclusion protein [Akkermansia sp.]
MPERVSHRHPLLRWLWRLSASAVAAALVLVAAADLWTELQAAPHCRSRAEDCRSGGVGVVLGCSRYLSRGVRSPFFEGRMEAAAALWRSGRVRCLIVSGDNSDRYYNEPREMRAALVARGVPAERIVCDYAGLRTYDSVLRARRIFGAEQVVLVSQKAHVHRAVLLARHFGLAAEGLEAPLVGLSRASHLRQMLRERAARVLMLLELFLPHAPRFLGEQVELPLSVLPPLPPTRCTH